MSTIPKPSLRKIRSRVATPVLVRTKPNKLKSVFKDIQAFDLENYVDKGILDGNIVDEIRDKTTSMYERMQAQLFNMFSMFLPREAIFNLADRKNVEKVFYDKPMYAFSPSYPTTKQDNIHKFPRTGTKFVTTSTTKELIGSSRATKNGYAGSGQTVGVIDTGGSRTHEQNRRMVFDTAMHAQRSDKNGHGQHCVSTIGGIRRKDEQTSRRINSDIYCEGMATQTDLVGIKALGYVIGTGSTSSIARAINMSVEDYNTDVISMSLGGASKEDNYEDDPYYSIFDKLKELDNAPIPVVAGGNSGPDANTIGSPGCLPNVLTVGAYNPISGDIAGFSSRGPTNWEDRNKPNTVKPDCIAPGVNIHSGIVGYLDGAGDKMKNRYSPLSGTSMATPHISGLVSQMRQAYKEKTGKTLTTEHVKHMLDVAYEGHKDNDEGYGPLTWGVFQIWMENEYGIDGI